MTVTLTIPLIVDLAILFLISGELYETHDLLKEIKRKLNKKNSDL